MKKMRQKHPKWDLDVLTFRDEHQQFQVPAVLHNRYEIVHILAMGGFGVLFSARDLRIFKRKVLIKANRYEPHLFHYPNDVARDKTISEQRERLEHEMKMLREAQRRNIAGTPLLIDLLYAQSPQLWGPHQSIDGEHFSPPIEQCEREPYLVLSYVEGMTLNQACQQPFFRRTLLKNVQTVAIQIAGTLHAFHQYKKVGDYQLSFLYQDLKPDNIIWTKTRDCVLIDFGSFAARTRDQMVPKNLFISTPPYQPPEFSGRMAPEDTILPTADVYSLGVTLLHLLRGSIPVDPSTGAEELSLDVLQLPKEWKEWLQKMLDPDPAERFQTMHELREQAFQLPVR